MNENLEDLKQKADQLLRDKNWDELIPVCTKIIALKQRPDAKASAYNNRGAAYDKKGDSDRAIADFDTAIELDPTNVDAYNNRGAAYDKKDDSDRAIADFDTAIELDPTNVDAYNNRGAAYDKKGDSGRAIADFDTAIELDPTNVGAYNNRGVAYLIKGDYDNAIMDFLDANRCDSNLRLGQPIVYIASQIENARISRKDMGEAFKCFVRLFSAIKDIQHSLCYKPESAKVTFPP